MPIIDDGAFHDRNRRLMYCSADRFVTTICDVDHRFICHRSELRAEFNREHILPNWLLREFGLHRVSVTLPNRELHGYVTEVGWRRARSLATRPLVTIADPGLRPRGEVR